MRAQTVLLLIFFILLSGPAFCEIYSFIDSIGRQTYTSDPSILPEGHEHKTSPTARNERLEPVDQQPIRNQATRIEHLKQRFELAKIEIDSKFEKLSDAPADEYVQAVQDILSLKFEILDLNEQIIELTAKSQEESEICLQRFYAWSEEVDLLLEKNRQTNGPQASNSRLEVPALSAEEVKRSDYLFTSSIKANTEKLNSSSSSTNSW